jgi:predicted Zn-dependent protease
MKKLLLTAFLMLAMAAQAQDPIAEAKQAIEKEDTYTAQKKLDAVLKDSPDNAEANFLMAKSYTIKRNFAQSRKYIDKAIALDPANVAYRKLRINSLNSSSSNQDLQNVIADLQYLISTGDKRAVIYSTLATAEKELGNNIFRFTENKSADTYKEAALHFENSKAAYGKAIEADQASKAKFEYEIKQLDLSISEVKKMI